MLVRKVFEVNNTLMKKIRLIYWRKLFGFLGNNSRILGRIKVYYPENVFVGHDTSINEATILNARAKLTIGNYCHISPAVTINTGSLDITVDYKKRPHFAKAVTIGDGVWLCSGAIINPGVNIGEGAVVAAGAVVKDDVGPFTVVAGNPAQFIKELKY